MTTDADLQAAIRQAIDRHLQRRAPAPAGVSVAAPAVRHASHVLVTIHAGSAIDDGRCLIEPSVPCNHCGYCQSYGH